MSLYPESLLLAVSLGIITYCSWYRENRVQIKTNARASEIFDLLQGLCCDPHLHMGSNNYALKKKLNKLFLHRTHSCLWIDGRQWRVCRMKASPLHTFCLCNHRYLQKLNRMASLKLYKQRLFWLVINHVREPEGTLCEGDICLIYNFHLKKKCKTVKLFIWHWSWPHRL